MDHIDLILSELCDDPAEYMRQGAEALLVRGGVERALKFREIPSVGTVVLENERDPEPFHKFVQQRILGLPQLASQVARTVQKTLAERPSGYIDGPAKLTSGRKAEDLDQTLAKFRQFLAEADSGTTRLVHLTAPAGQGKTVLLEKLAHETATSYVPDVYPVPFVLTVDLLGRYVGTLDDAIAGSLNNTYKCPGLTQRDVSLCIRQRWLILALDGFDELAARVGVRDAFARASELLDQLRSAGTVILSARESFFELYQVTVALRSHLQPREGSYSTYSLTLRDWSDKQGLQVFQSLNTTDPRGDLDELLTAFGADRQIVLQPFLLTRLASLWAKGVRFDDAEFGGSGSKGEISRTAYVIRTFVDREAREKWVDRESKPLLEPEQQTRLLAGIAGEMWRSAVFSFTLDELKIAGDLALDPNLAPVVRESALEKLPLHAAIPARGGRFAFVHDRFFHHYLAFAVHKAVSQADAGLPSLLDAGVFSMDLVPWFEWFHDQEPIATNVVGELCGLGRGSMQSSRATNAAMLLGVILTNRQESSVLTEVTFSGQFLRGRTYRNVTFQNCQFWQLDLTDSVFVGCHFDACRFDSVLVATSTRFTKTTFKDAAIRSLQPGEDGPLFSPEEIQAILVARGATVVTPAVVKADALGAVPPELVKIVAKLVRWSERSCDIAREEIEEEYGADGKKLIDLALESGVVKKQHRGVSGPPKSFVRFQVDRELLLRGQAERTADARIDGFWNRVRAWARGRR